MSKQSMKVEITFIEPLLGTLSGNKELAEEFIMSKHPDGPQEDELQAETPTEEVTKCSTIFPQEDGKPFLWDYQIKGFFKDACSMLNRADAKNRLQAYKKVIDGLVFPQPRKIFLKLSGKTTFTERPLRAQTAKGERIALARSETAPIGTKILFEVRYLDGGLKSRIKSWLDYGVLRGLGQWRNSGAGRFTYRIV